MRSTPNGDETQALQGIAKRKETKCGEKTVRKSQRPIVVFEAGERALPDPVEQRGCRVVDRGLEPRRGHRASKACHRETAWSCEGQRTHDVTNRMRLTRTSGSVGGLGGRPPRSTRPLRGIANRLIEPGEEGSHHGRSPVLRASRRRLAILLPASLPRSLHFASSVSVCAPSCVGAAAPENATA